MMSSCPSLASPLFQTNHPSIPFFTRKTSLFRNVDAPWSKIDLVDLATSGLDLPKPSPNTTCVAPRRSSSLGPMPGARPTVGLCLMGVSLRGVSC